MQPLLKLPDPRGDWMHHRHLQVLLERLDDWQRAPAGAEHVDRIGALVAEEALLDMRIDPYGRELLHLVERHVDAIHAAHLEARIDEILREDRVELVGKIGRADETRRLD